MVLWRAADGGRPQRSSGVTVTTEAHDRHECSHGVARREFARFAALYRIEYADRPGASEPDTV